MVPGGRAPEGGLLSRTMREEGRKLATACLIGSDGRERARRWTGGNRGGL